MKLPLLVFALGVFGALKVNAQTPFVDINSENIKDQSSTFYGTDLSVLAEKDTILSTAMINYNPAIPFNGVDDYLEIEQDLSNLRQVTMYTIFQPEASEVSKEVWGIDGEESIIGLTTERAFNNKRQTFYEGAKEGNPLMHMYMQLYSGKSTTPTTLPKISLGVLKIDSTGTNDFFKGSIAEVIGYKSRLRGKTKKKVETALAIKYGITLTNGEDYLSSANEKIWESDDDDFTNNVLGIGRDDVMEVYQKQSTSSSAPEFMVLSADLKATSNLANTATFQDGNYIVIGDDLGDLTAVTSDDGLTTVGRKWLVKATGNQVKNIDTQLQINVSTMFDKLYELDNYVLVINEDAEEDFSTESEFLKPEELSATGILTINGVNWDTDRSDKDVFSIAFKLPLEITLESEDSAVCADGFTSMEYEAEGGIGTYEYSLEQNGTVVKTWTSEEDESLDYTLEDIEAGTYTITVTDVLGDYATATYTIIQEAPITVDLGEDQSLELGEDLTLKAEISDVEAVESYEWSSDNGFFSTDKTITIEETGIYTLTITSELGCEYSDEITIDNGFIKKFIIYPNPSTDGNYAVDIEIAEKGTIQVNVYNSIGTLLDNYSAKNKFKTTVKGSVPDIPGFYEIMLITAQGTVTKKLIVN